MNISIRFGQALVLLSILCLAGCAAAPARVNQGLKDRELPRRMVLLPVDITVNEMSAGGVIEKDPEWTRVATEMVTRAVEAQMVPIFRVEKVPMPATGEEDEEVIREHLALYNVVGGAALNIGNTPGWEHKQAEFDYTLGPGLRFLREKADADAALIIIGQDTVTTAGRKTMAILAGAAGVAIPVGSSYLTAGVIDLETGDILWLNSTFEYARRDLRNPGDAQAMIAGLFATFPGPGEGK